MKRMQEKWESRKGFTLAELLIVVAIIGVLVAIAFPVFSSQLDKARASTEKANARSAYAEAITIYLNDSTKTTLSKSYDGVTYAVTINGDTGTGTVALTGKKSTSGADSYTFPES